MKEILLCLTWLFALNSFAGERGNGGVSVVCRNQDDSIKSAQILDLYEGEVLHGKIYDEARSYENRIKMIESLLVNYPVLYLRIVKAMEKLDQSFQFIPEGNELLLTDDALPTIIRRGCKFEQLANFINQDNILVSSDIYNNLTKPNLNKFALVTHEAIYLLLRKFGAKDSRVARQLTSMILAENTTTTEINLFLEKEFGLNQKETCGITGTLNDRIRNCFFKKDEAVKNFTLVSTLDGGLKIHFQESTGLLWTNLFSDWVDYSTAGKMCSRLSPVNTGNTLIWRLPTSEEIYSAYEENIMKTIGSGDDLGTWMWTTTKNPAGTFSDYYNKALDLRTGNYFRRNVSDRAHFICVQSIK